MQVDADSLGNYLRRERERQQVSLQDISAATKIQLQFLKEIEEDAYDRLPPAPFVIGFLRAYAQCLALDPEEIVAAYHARYGPSEELESQRLFVAYQAKHPKQFSRKSISIALIITVLVAGFIYFLSREQEARTAITPTPVVVETASEGLKTELEPLRLASGTQYPQITAPTTEPTPGTASDSGPVQGPIRPSSDRDQALPVVAAAVPEEQTPHRSEAESLAAFPEEFSLEIPPSSGDAFPTDSPPLLVLQAIAVEDTWLRVDIDEDKRHALLLTSGKSIQWEAVERFVLTVGNAHGTRLLLDGHDVSLPPTRSNVVRDFVLTRDVVN